MRITVSNIQRLAQGMKNEEILEDIPELTLEDILASLAFAAEHGKMSQ